MKYFWVALGILAVLFLSSLSFLTLLETTAASVISNLERAQQAAAQEDYASAVLLTRQAQREWERYEGLFCTLLDHAETDEITFLFSALQVCAQQPVEDELQFRCAELIAMLQHIAEMEKPYYYNIL